jgi:hypothetical protein
MKNIFKLCTVLILLINCSSSQTSETKHIFSGNIKADLIYLLPEGKKTVDILDSVKLSPRQTELTLKFQKGIQENQSWFLEYMKKNQNGQSMPYHPNFGVTESEWKELQDHIHDIEMVSSGKEEVNVMRKDDIISFKSSGKLAFMNIIKIDLKKNIVSLENYKLPFIDTLNITEETGAFKSKWKGYEWGFEEPKDFNLDALKDLSSFTAKDYKLIIGRIEKSDRTFLKLKGQEYENGKAIVNFEIPILF